MEIPTCASGQKLDKVIIGSAWSSAAFNHGSLLKTLASWFILDREY
jgi:hypothetical protein